MTFIVEKVIAHLQLASCSPAQNNIEKSSKQAFQTTTKLGDRHPEIHSAAARDLVTKISQIIPTIMPNPSKKDKLLWRCDVLSISLTSRFSGNLRLVLASSMSRS
jgi:hypothetical protein